MPRFGIGRNTNFWIEYLWEFSTDFDLANTRDRICQLIGTNFESYIEDLEADYQESLITNIQDWLHLFELKFTLFFRFLKRARILEDLTNALAYYNNSDINSSPFSLDSFNNLTETYSIAPTVRLTYDIADCIVELCSHSHTPDWEYLDLISRSSDRARIAILQAVFRIKGNNRHF